MLRNRLVDIYRSGEPDLLTVMLESDGFDDLVSPLRVPAPDRGAGLRRSSAGCATLRNDTRDDRRAGRRRTATRSRPRRPSSSAPAAQLEAREAELDAVRDEKAAALDQVNSDIEQLEGDVSDIQGQIQQQIQAAQPTTGVDAAARGPDPGRPAAGLIWPVNGPVTSPFGWRWGRMHEGIDIAVPAGTPIRAAKAGNVILAALHRAATATTPASTTAAGSRPATRTSRATRSAPATRSPRAR